MSKLISAALRMTALVLMYFAIFHFIEMFYTWQQNRTVLPSQWFSLMMLVLIAMLLWFKNIPISQSLLNHSDTSVLTEINLQNLLRAAILIMSLGIAVFALIDLAQILIYASRMIENPHQISQYNLKWSYIIVFIKMMSALILIKFNRGIMNLLLKF